MLEAIIVVASQATFPSTDESLFKAPYNIALHPSALVTRSQSVAAKVIGSNDRPQIRLFLKSAQVVSHPGPIAHLRSSSRCIFLAVKACWLLIQQEDVSMRRTTWRWCGANVIGDKGSARSCQCGDAIGCSLGLEAGLDPV